MGVAVDRESILSNVLLYRISIDHKTSVVQFQRSLRARWRLVASLRQSEQAVFDLLENILFRSHPRGVGGYLAGGRGKPFQVSVNTSTRHVNFWILTIMWSV